MRGPGRILALPAQHLRKKERAIQWPVGALASKWAACVEFPVPKCEYKNIGDPQCARRTQQCSWRLSMPWDPLDEENQRSDHRNGDNAIGGERQDSSHLVIAAPVGDDHRNH